MTATHYKLPYDTEVDKDIHDWINSFHRTKKGEMVRHAIRYYMAVQDGEMFKFPNMQSEERKTVATPVSQQEVNRRERVKPNLNLEAIK